MRIAWEPEEDGKQFEVAVHRKCRIGFTIFFGGSRPSTFVEAIVPTA